MRIALAEKLLLYNDIMGRTQLKLLFIIPFVLVFYQNCGDISPRHEEGGASSFNLERDAEGELRFEKAKVVLDKHCTTCHKAGGSASFLALDFENEVNFLNDGIVIPGDINNSRVLIRNLFYTGTKDTRKNMPMGGNPTGFTEEEHKVLVEWVAKFNDRTEVDLDGEIFRCDPNKPSSVDPLMRLTKVQYENTLRDLIEGINTSQREALTNSVKTHLVDIPDDQNDKMDRFDNKITPQSLHAQFKVAESYVEHITSDKATYLAFAGGCMSAVSPDQSCVEGFISKFGLRTYRRPMTAAEIAEHYNYYSAGGSYGLRNLMIRMLMAPDFLYHLQVKGIELFGENKFQLTPYELASKLSYQYWDTMPDTTLLNLAENNSISNSVGFDQALSHVFAVSNTSKYTPTLNRFVNQWLHLEKIPNINSQNSPAFGTFAGELDFEAHDYRADMVDEIYELFNYYTNEVDGTYADILTSNLSVSRSTQLAALYGVQVRSGASAPPQFPQGKRAGLLTRSAFLLSGSEKTSPIHRGARIRQEILCNQLPAPPADAAASVKPIDNDSLTTREKVDIITQEESCYSCHKHFNGFGYGLESYDSVGRNRVDQFEKIFDKDGKFVHNLKINDQDSMEFDYGEPVSFSGGVELSQQVSDTEKSHACFARNYYRYSKRRLESVIDSSDDCNIKQIYETLRKSDGSLKEMYKSFSRGPTFNYRKLKD